jgi:glycosyltransferase involved in cell wall biosynthesis
MRIVQLTNDNREIQKKYHLDEPVFGPAPEALLEGFKALGDKVEVHVVSCLQQLPRRSPATLADNIFYHPLHVPKIGWLRTGYQGCIRATRRKIRELQPDIVHGQGTERDCSMCAVFSGLPNVVTIHGNMRAVASFLRAKPFTYYWLAAKLERICLKRTNGVVAISNYTRSNVSPYTDNVWLIPNAVHPSFFNVRRKPDPLPRILCTANISIYKNQIGLVRALEPLAGENAFKLLFAGAGHESDPYFRSFKEAISIRPWCEYLGPLSRPALQEQMASAYMGILPSFEDNCPMVVLEAGAAGLPIAASRVGGMPDIIKDRETGRLFDPRNPQSIGDAIAAFLTDRPGVNAMANNARSVCLSRYSAEAVARRHLEIYKEVTQSGGSRAAK